MPKYQDKGDHAAKLAYYYHTVYTVLRFACMIEFLIKNENYTQSETYCQSFFVFLKLRELYKHYRN